MTDRRWHIIAWIAALVAAFILSAIFDSANASTYYVSKVGSDDSTGLTWQAAWETTVKVQATFAGGDTVYFGTGIWRGTQLSAAGGTLTDRTVYACSAFVQGIAQWWGSTQATVWTQYSGSVYRGRFPQTSAIYAVFQGDSLMWRQTSLAAVNSAGKFYQTSNGDTFYVWVHGGDDPDNYDMEIAPDGGDIFAVEDGEDDVTLWGITVKYGGPHLIRVADGDGGLQKCPDRIYIDHVTGWGAAGGLQSNTAIVYFARMTDTHDSSFASTNSRIYACTLRYATENPVQTHNAAAVYTYGMYHSQIWNNYIDKVHVGIYVKGQNLVGATNCYISIAYNTIIFDEYYGIYMHSDAVYDSIYGNTFICLGDESEGYNQGFSITAPGSGYNYGHHYIGNNTFIGANSALSAGGSIGPNNEFKYNVVYDAAGGENATSVTESNWSDIDSNLYRGQTIWDGGNFTSWNNKGFDAQSDSSTNPDFDTIGTELYARPRAGTEMNVTAGGRTWTIYGAWQPATGTASTIATGNNQGGALIHGPRWKGAKTGDTLTLVMPISGTTEEQYAYSYDNGLTWTTEDTIIDLGLDYHTSTALAGGRLHITFPDGNNLTYRSIDSPYTKADTNSKIVLRDGAEYRSSVTARADTAWVVGRVSASTPALYVYRSTNGGATFTDSSQINIADGNCRVGSLLDVDGVPWVVALVYNNGFYRWQWNGTVFDSPADSIISIGLATYNDNQRMFTVNYVEDRMHMVVGTGDYLFSFAEDGVGGWDSTIVTTNTAFDGEEFYPASCVRGNTFYLFYAVDSSFVYKTWTAADGWNPDATVVTGSDSVNQDINTVPRLDTTDNRLPVFWRNSQEQIRFNYITLADYVGGGEPPPETLSIVQSITASATDSSALLIDNLGNGEAPYDSLVVYWSATRSAVATGPTARYSLITSATDPDSVAIPDLTAATTYYFRIAAFDAGAYADTTAIDSVVTGNPPSDYIIIPSADSVQVCGTYSGYSTTHIDNVTIAGRGGTASTWASDSNIDSTHWIILYLDSTYTIGRATIWWAYNSSQSLWSESAVYDLQFWSGGEWLRADSVTNFTPEDSVTETTFSTPISTDRFKFYQPAGYGPPTYQKITWLTEIDLYSTEAVATITKYFMRLK